jgi:hypothetical protein
MKASRKEEKSKARFDCLLILSGDARDGKEKLLSRDAKTSYVVNLKDFFLFISAKSARELSRTKIHLCSYRNPSKSLWKWNKKKICIRFTFFFIHPLDSMHIESHIWSKRAIVKEKKSNLNSSSLSFRSTCCRTIFHYIIFILPQKRNVWSFFFLSRRKKVHMYKILNRFPLPGLSRAAYWLNWLLN